MELCRGQPLCFGGLGLMLERPSLTLGFHGEAPSGNTQFDMPDEYAKRAQQVVALRSCRNRGRQPEVIEITQTVDLHTGLGTGTQLACAVALGLEVFEQQLNSNRWTDNTWVACETAIEAATKELFLVQHSGRGLRSAVGLAGFLSGGLILDQGYRESDPGARRVQVRSTNLPSEWRVVMLRPRHASSLCGGQESDLLDEIGKQANPNREPMRELAIDLMQACSEANFANFSTGLDQYMQFAGEIFRSLQGGLYNGEAVIMAVATARNAGLSAVGQSSWGPTVFGFSPSEARAKAAVEVMSLELPASQWHIALAKPATHGAQFRWSSGFARHERP